MTTLSKLNNRQVLFLLMSMAFISVFISGIANSTHADGDWLAGLFSNLGTEMIGAVLTYALFEMILGERQRQQEKEQATESRKRELILQMASRVNETAIQALESMRPHGWLTDGSLQGVSLAFANLQKAYLRDSHLQQADLWYVNLKEANLRNTNLQGVNLGSAHLQGAKLTNANLKGAKLTNANLQGAEDIQTVSFDETTTLPDGSMWTAQTDLARFTDSNHPKFWRSDDPDSPAYKGKSKRG